VVVAVAAMVRTARTALAGAVLEVEYLAQEVVTEWVVVVEELRKVPFLSYHPMYISTDTADAPLRYIDTVTVSEGNTSVFLVRSSDKELDAVLEDH
jgi:hypothetical protein